jgi:hypothetical protein
VARVRLFRKLLILLVAVWLLAELVAIPLAGQTIEREVVARDRGAAEVHASVGSFPILARLALTGRVKRVTVVLDRVAQQRLTFAELRFDVRGVLVDRADLIARKFTVRDIDDGTVTGTINLSDISPLAGRIASRVNVTGHTLSLGGLSYALNADLFPCSPEATVAGDSVTLSCTFTEVPDVLLRAQR